MRVYFKHCQSIIGKCLEMSFGFSLMFNVTVKIYAMVRVRAFLHVIIVCSMFLYDPEAFKVLSVCL